MAKFCTSLAPPIVFLSKERSAVHLPRQMKKGQSNQGKLGKILGFGVVPVTMRKPFPSGLWPFFWLLVARVNAEAMQGTVGAA